ncbi:MAG: ATP-grasp domain-containing protein, partial [Actinomycetia bacterium]|nr:ATP-grasp domain-containing protein [Actinomycetes bacterium]
EKEAIEFVKKASFPVIIKASSGGGGKGMRIVHTEKDLIKSLQLASAEAQSAFGDSSIYLEKYIEEPRHIEVQILGDRHGNVISLGERDCSIQRRHQKLIEESPGPSLTEENRKEICELAIKVAKTVNYQGAGTVEFLIDSSGRSYFMEMNTRLQVEHPVTEEVTGIDIVKEQIRIATGEELNHKQNEISPKGHAIEFRINAENPEEDFLPSSGKVNLYVPSGGLGVRVDSHLYTGYQIPPFYDSLLAKLIVWGESREEAISRAKRALDEFIVVGVPTTIGFHKKVVNNAFFHRAEFYTNFIQKRILNE